MHLSEESFQLAHTDFFEAFKCFDEAGSPRRISSLKYLGKAYVRDIRFSMNHTVWIMNYTSPIKFQSLKFNFSFIKHAFKI